MNDLTLVNKKKIILSNDFSDEAQLFKNALIKQMNTVIDVLNKNNVTWWITGGTLLGFYRDNDIIPADYDTDLAIAAETMNEQCVIDLCNMTYNRITDNNMYLVNKKNVLYSINNGGYVPTRNWKFEQTELKFFGELEMTPQIDIFPYVLYKEKRWKRVYPERMRWHLDSNMLPINKLNCKYGCYNTPHNVEEYLRLTYGNDWKTPKYLLDMHHDGYFENRVNRSESGDIRIDMKTKKSHRFSFPYKTRNLEHKILNTLL